MKTTEGKFKFRFLGRSPNKREVNIPLPLTRLKDYVQERFRSNPGYQTTRAQDKRSAGSSGIDTGKGGQQFVDANPISRAVLF